MVLQWDTSGFTTALLDYYGPGTAAALEKINVWLARDDSVAVYENAELGGAESGAWQITSYGSPAAQIEAEYPPDRMPDIGGRINWRYVLIGTYTGPEVEL